MITIINLKKAKPWPEGMVYCGRENTWLGLKASKWANPFPMKNEGQRPEVLSKYRDYVLNSPGLLSCLHELDGKILSCYCHPKKCHCDILVELRELQLKGLL